MFQSLHSLFIRKRSIFFSLLEKFALLITNLTAFLILLRILGVQEYGTWVLFISLTSTIELIRTGLVRNAFIKFFFTADNANDHSLIESSAFLLNIITTYFFAGIIAAFSPFLSQIWQSPDLASVLNIYFIVVFSSILYSHFETVLHIQSDFKSIFVATLIDKGVFTFILGLLSFFEINPQLSFLVFVKAFTQLIGALILIFYSKNETRLAWKTSIKWFNSLINYGKYVMLTNISSIILRNIDIWMIGYIIDPTSVAIYSIAIRVANLYEVPSNAFVSVTFPKFVRLVKDKATIELKFTYEKTVSLISAFMIPMIILIIAFSEEIIALIGSTEYLSAYKILNILMLTGLLLPYNKFSGILLEADGKAQLNTVLTIFYVIINGVLNYLFISYYDLIGAAIATLLSYAIIFFINQKLLNSFYQISIKSYPILVYKYYLDVFHITKKIVSLKKIM